jgi:predicted transcriptional regulator
MGNTTSLKLPEELKEKVGKLAQGVAQTPHAYMVEAIARKVERDEKRQAFIQAAIESAEETKRTGIAYAHDDVWDYILKKARGQKARKPKPIKLPKTKR